MARGRVLAAVALTQSPLRDFPFRQPGLLGKLLYGVTVSVAGIKIHARIDTGRIAPEDRLNPRSEEHTSELQSLMRISYAVFCLKKKNISKNTTTQYKDTKN